MKLRGYVGGAGGSRSVRGELGQRSRRVKKGITSAAWGDAVRQVRGPLDPFGARKLTSATFATSLPNAPRGQYVVIQFETKAARGNTVVETVTPVHEPDGAWRVSGYYVRPR